ncbi:MAG: hypothetical protein HY538_07545 [Deltaproteobacteria bacterium]|nr:hypothetical protein [Deltaproteobacteria bacterium]
MEARQRIKETLDPIVTTVLEDILIVLVNKLIPFGQGYRTAILLTLLPILALLDASGVGPGDLLKRLAPYVLGTAIPTALAHPRRPRSTGK